MREHPDARGVCLDRHGWADAMRPLAATAPGDQLVEVDKAPQPHHEVAGEQSRAPREPPPAARVVDRGSRERVLDGLDAGREDVPEEEEQDPGRGRREKRARRAREPPILRTGRPMKPAGTTERLAVPESSRTNADDGFPFDPARWG